jgi:hypothetical protein
MKTKLITYSLGIATSMLLSRAFKQSGEDPANFDNFVRRYKTTRPRSHRIALD